MNAKKIMEMTDDNKRVTFFAWSHLTGWLLANAQTIWIIWELRVFGKSMNRHTRWYSLAIILASFIGTTIIVATCGKQKNKAGN